MINCIKDALIMDLYIDVRDAGLRSDEGRNAFIAQFPDDVGTIKPEKIEDFKYIFGEKRYLLSKYSDAVMYIVFVDSVVSLASTCTDSTMVCRLGDTLSGLLFEKDVPNIIKIRMPQSRVEMTIKTRGKRMVVLDIPLILANSYLTNIMVSFDKKCEFRYIYDLYESDIRRILKTVFMMLHKGHMSHV